MKITSGVSTEPEKEKPTKQQVQSKLRRMFAQHNKEMGA